MQLTSIITDYFNFLPDYVKKVLKEYEKQLPFNKFYIYKDYLLNHTTTRLIKFDKNRWYLRPHLYCYDNYSDNEQYLYPIILTVNNIKSIHEFKSDSFKDQIVYTPSINLIQEVLTKK